MQITTVDCHYVQQPGVAAAYLLREGDRAAFVETNTSLAVPRLLAALDQQGLSPAQVELIVITHIHLDHAGGAGQLMQACPNATLLAHPRAAPHAVDPARIVAGASKVYGAARFAEMYGEVLPIDGARVRALEHGAVVPFGEVPLEFLHTRGHANHHFVMHVASESCVFTGDAFGVLYRDLQGNGPFVFPSSSPTDFDAEAAHASVDAIVATGATTVFPTHFGGHKDLPLLAGQLHRLLDEHGAVVEQADVEGWEDDVLDARCEARVQRIFKEMMQRHGFAGDAKAWKLASLDAELNAQGLAFAVRKRRFKRSRG